MDLSKIISKVFLWMFVGLAVTFVTGSVVAGNPDMLSEIFSTGAYWIIVILELGTVIFLSARIHKMSSITAKISFIIYSFLTGLTFSSIFVVYKIESIMIIFLVTSLLMLIFSLIGYFTKLDLTKLGTYLMMILIGIIILSIINIFVGNESLDLVLCIISLVVFILFIAYDIQKIKQLFNSNILPEDNLAIYGALELYLDFINIFIELLRIFGNNKD